MAKIPTYERQVQVAGVPAPDTNTGTSERLAATRGMFSRLAGQVGAMADRAASSEGERAGLMAGLDPEFRPGRQNSLYGEAYDRAGTRAWLDSRANELSQQIDQLSIQHEANPAGLAAAINDLEAQTVGALKDQNFPEAEVAFAGFFGRARTSYVREAIRAKTERDKQLFLATANDAYQRRSNEIDRITFSGGLDDEAAATAAAAVEEEARANEAMVEAGVITPEEARRRNEALEKRATIGPFLGAFDRLKTVEEKQQLLADFKKRYAAGELGDMIAGDDAEAVIRQMETRISAAQSDRAAAVTQVDRAANSIEDRAADGFSAPESEVAALRAAAEATGDETAIARADAAERYRKLGEQLVAMRPLDIDVLRRQTVLDMDANGATERSVEVLKAIDGVKAKMLTALETDPYAWGVRAGAIDRVPAITFDGGPAMAATLNGRLAARDTLRQRYGTVPFFTKAEKELLSGIARDGGAPALGVARSLVQALGGEAGDVLAEISTDAPVLANMAGRLANGGSALAAEDAMAGLAARRLPDFKPATLSDAQEALAARDALGGAYMADPRAESAVRAEARLVLEKRARDQGRVGDLSKDPEALELYRQALDEVAGAVTKNGVKHGGIDLVNGAEVIVPTDAFEGEVEGLLHRITDLSRLPPIETANGVEISARQIQGATLVTVGNGRWRVALGDPRTADPRYVMAPDGKFWTVTLEDLRKAAPDLQPADITRSARAGRRWKQ